MIKKRNGWLILIVILLLVGCMAEDDDWDMNPFSTGKNQVENIEKYLITNFGSIGFGGVVSCRYEPLNAEQFVDDKIYLFVICLEHYMEGDNLILGSGATLPVVLHVEQKNDTYETVDHLTPFLGEYAEDVYEYFPESSWPQIFHDDSEFNDRIGELIQDLEESARLSFED
jgi:hypothetical protein